MRRDAPDGSTRSAVGLGLHRSKTAEILSFRFPLPRREMNKAFDFKSLPGGKHPPVFDSHRVVCLITKRRAAHANTSR